MEGSVGRVLEQVGDQHGHGQLHDERPIRYSRLHLFQPPAAEDRLGWGFDRHRRELHDKMADDEVNKISLPLNVEFRLLSAFG